MNKLVPFGSVRKLTLVWLGLLALNLFLGLPQVEGLFSSKSRVEGYTGNICLAKNGSYTHKKESGSSILFVFVGGLAGGAAENTTSPDLLSVDSLIGKKKQGLKKQAFEVTNHCSFLKKSKNSSRAPPRA